MSEVSFNTEKKWNFAQIPIQCKKVKSKYSQHTLGKESKNASKQKKILTCFLKKSQLSDFQEKIDSFNALRISRTIFDSLFVDTDKTRKKMRKKSKKSKKKLDLFERIWLILKQKEDKTIDGVISIRRLCTQ